MTILMIAIYLAMGSTGLGGEGRLPSELAEPLPRMMISRHVGRGLFEEMTIAPGDKEHEAVTRFLRENGVGWTSDIRTFAGGVTLRADGFVINCLSSGVVINFRVASSSAWQQISKHTTAAFCGLDFSTPAL